MNAATHRKFEDEEVGFKDIMFRGEPAYFTDSALGLINFDPLVMNSRDDMTMTPEISKRYDIITSIMTRELYDYSYLLCSDDNKMAYIDGRYLAECAENPAMATYTRTKVTTTYQTPATVVINDDPWNIIGTVIGLNLPVISGNYYEHHFSSVLQLDAQDIVGFFNGIPTPKPKVIQDAVEVFKNKVTTLNMMARMLNFYGNELSGNDGFQDIMGVLNDILKTDGTFDGISEMLKDAVSNSSDGTKEKMDNVTAGLKNLEPMLQQLNALGIDPTKIDPSTIK